MNSIARLVTQTKLMLSFAVEAMQIGREIESADFDPGHRQQRVARAVQRWRARVDAQLAQAHMPAQNEAYALPESNRLQFSR